MNWKIIAGCILIICCIVYGIVTNDFHVFRGVHLARHAGLAGAVGIAAKSTRLYLPSNMFRETFGILKDFVMGNLV